MKDSKFSFGIKLKQHTPIIHFQHEQQGATLRATEVKPKLDRYLIENAFNNNEPDYKKYKIGGPKGAHPALDYKLKILAGSQDIPSSKIEKGDRNVPMFFGNMGNDYNDNPKGLAQYNGAYLEFFSFHPDLITKLKEHIAGFFARHNFGMRQSKGYGSFTVDQPYDFPGEFYRFSVRTNDETTLLKTIDLFYKSLRSGINGGTPPNWDRGFSRNFYMKPLLFLYAKKNNIQWEKKSIKESFFSSQLHKQQQDHQKDVESADRPNWPLWIKKEDKRIVRDVLGLSTEQTWRGYGSGNGAGITKDHTTAKGGKVKDDQTISRFRSPLFFKPVRENERTFRVYFRAEAIPETYLNAHFLIKKDGVPMESPIPMWKGFDLPAFLDFAFKEGKLEAAMQYKRSDRAADEIARTLIQIYSEIRKNRENVSK